MAYRSFREVFSIRVLLLAGTLALFLFLLRDTRLYAITALVGAGVVYQVVRLIALVEVTNRVTGEFLAAVAASDYSESFTTGLAGSSFDELNDTFRDLATRFREISVEKEATLRYLRAIVRQVGVGLVTYDESGRLELVNEAARQLLGLDGADGDAEIDPELAASFAGLEPGRRELVKLRRGHELYQLSLRATELRLGGRKITLVTVSNIAVELDEKEMEAWQNLIRVFTHEIKNSLTPIASLAATVESLLIPEDGEPGGLPEDHAGDVAEALSTIRERSQGLLEFLDAYRDLTHVPQPEPELFTVAEAVSRAEQLVADRLQEGAVAFEASIEPETLQLEADPRLVEQVLLNLLLNAVQALEGRSQGKITVSARQDAGGHVVIQVSDNGPGIVEGVLEKVFVPFFSTRSDGSGIGLCLSRQIMRRHHGELTVQSVPEKETTFTMRF